MAIRADNEHLIIVGYILESGHFDYPVAIATAIAMQEVDDRQGSSGTFGSLGYDYHGFKLLMHGAAINLDGIYFCGTGGEAREGEQEQEKIFHSTSFGISRYLYIFDIKLISF
jgi:hypothetical protein